MVEVIEKEYSKEDKLKIIKHLFDILNDSSALIPVWDFELIDHHDLWQIIVSKKAGKF